jgi:hypothetical protein
MAATPETGFLLIADLTGYTAYLSQSELEHAPVIAGDLLESIVGRLDPPFRLAKFEGDAAFLYVEEGRMDASLVLEAIEASYLAFRRRLRSIDQATSCDCNSCNLAPGLDLKLFVHHGSYVRTRIAGRDELAGRDVIIVHRLLKGAAAAAARASGFVLFTAAAVKALRLEPASLGLAATQEWIEHLGQVSTFRLDLESRWRAESQLRRLDLVRARNDPRHRGHVCRRAFGGLGPPNLAVASNNVGGAACYRGNVARRPAWRRNCCPMRFRSARHP